jgi:hypothetical protein
MEDCVEDNCHECQDHLSNGGGTALLQRGSAAALPLLVEHSQISEGFCENLTRQITVAHLSQLRLRFRRRHIWVSVVAVES